MSAASAVGLAKIFNEKTGYFRRKIRVHELIIGSLTVSVELVQCDL